MFTNTARGRRLPRRRAAGGRYLLERMVDAGARPRSGWTSPSSGGRTSSRSSPAALPDARWPSPTTAATTSAALDKLLQMLDYRKFRAEQAGRAQAGPAARHRVLAPTSRRARSRPRRWSGALGAGAGLYESGKVRVHPTGGGDGVHGLALPRSGPRDDVRPARGRRARHPHGAGGDRPRRHRRRSRSAWAPTAAARPRSAAPRSSCRWTRSRRRASRSPPICWRPRRAGHRVRERPVPGQGRARQGRAVRRSRADGLRRRTTIPEGLEPGLEETSFYDPSNFCFPFGAHACVVEVDRDTGHVKILRYVAVDDVGNVINPMIVDGMVHGGIAQGVGQALWEGARLRRRRPARDRARMMDYAMPKADMLPIVRDGPHGDADARSIRSASRARARRAPSPPPRRSSTPSSTRWRPLGVDHIERCR